MKYGIYNTATKKFQFGISEDSKTKAQIKLKKKIGYDALKWRFEPRPLPEVPKDATT